MESLRGKNVLVVGATGDIGFHTAKLLQGSGANLFLTGRDSALLNNYADQLGLSGDHYLAIDLSQADAGERLAKAYFEKYPTIDILVNASGVGIIKPVESLTEEDFLQSLQVNLVAPFKLLKAFLPSMKVAKKGLIINIPGVLGKVPMAGAAAYSASKYGLVGMMQSIREEIKRTDIRITNVFMGGVNSGFWDTIDLRVQREKMIQPEEAARSIWFLCQQPASGVVSEFVLQPFNHQAI